MAPRLGWRSRQSCYRAEGLSSIPSMQRKGILLGVQTCTAAPEGGDEKTLGAHRCVNTLCSHTWLCGSPLLSSEILLWDLKSKSTVEMGETPSSIFSSKKRIFSNGTGINLRKEASFPRREHECYPDDKSCKQTARWGNTLVQCLRNGKSMWQKSSVLASWPSSCPFHQHLSQTQKQQWSPRHQGLKPNHNSTNVFPATYLPSYYKTDPRESFSM